MAGKQQKSKSCGFAIIKLIERRHRSLCIYTLVGGERSSLATITHVNESVAAGGILKTRSGVETVIRQRSWVTGYASCVSPLTHTHAAWNLDESMSWDWVVAHLLPLWRRVSCSLSRGPHTFHAAFSSLLKTLMLLSQLKCSALLDNPSLPSPFSHAPPHFILCFLSPLSLSPSTPFWQRAICTRILNAAADERNVVGWCRRRLMRIYFIE